MRTSVACPPLVSRGISRFPRKERLHMPGSLTTPGCLCTRVDVLGMLPSANTTASAPGIILSRLNGWPMHSPTDASPLASRPAMHGSGSMWFAIPSSCRTFTDYSLPASRRTAFDSAIETAEVGRSPLQDLLTAQPAVLI